MNHEKSIDMRGYNVVYNDQTYSCLQMQLYNMRELRSGDFVYHDLLTLRVTVINSDGLIETLDDASFNFHFIKE